VCSRVHVWRARTRFRRYRRYRVPYSCFRSQTCFQRCGWRRVPFSCFTLPDSFSAVPRASGPVFMFCVHALVFGGSDRIGSRFHVLRSCIRFRRCGGRRVPFSCSARQNSFSAVPTASCPVFMLGAPVLIFGGSVGVGSNFHVLRSWTHFRR
jgi:hypothetical protein